MNEQQAFNKAYLGVLKQGDVSFCFGEDASMYRVKIKGKLYRCGIGHLIEKKHYKPCMEKKEVGILADGEWLPPTLYNLRVSVLEELQAAHDHVKHTSTPQQRLEQFCKNMQVVANHFNLKVPC